jgi:hypothetical protein
MGCLKSVHPAQVRRLVFNALAFLLLDGGPLEHGRLVRQDPVLTLFMVYCHSTVGELCFVADRFLRW